MLESCSGVLCRAMRAGWTVFAGLVLACPAMPVHGATISDLGFQWCRVGDAGNRGTTPAEMRNNVVPGFDFNPSLGAVNYEFNIAKTETTLGQYAEFVRAYAPVWRARNPGAATLPRDLLGTQIQFFLGEITLFGDEHSGYGMTFEYAARMCNWLHNGMSSVPEAFDNGAYDMARFGVPITPGGTLTWPEHSPDATYWIPSIHEWTKAAYWDPNKTAPDGSQGGYWQYSGMQDTPLIGGPPGVGQTDAFVLTEFPPVGAYTDVMSPWGLLGTSGGVNEWTETTNPLFSDGGVSVRNSRAGSPSDESSDRVGDIFTSAYRSGGIKYGLRLATTVPSPGSCLAIAPILLHTLIRRSRP